MTKKEIANLISTEMGIPQTVVLEVIQRTFDSIISTLETEGRIELRDFAMFEVVMRKGRNARNPRNGEKVVVPEREKVKFTPGREMTTRVREGMMGKSEDSVSEDTARIISFETKVDFDV